MAEEMESELHRLLGHQGYEEEPRHSAVEGESVGEHHLGEKKSVMRKVKDKAKKIKDTIKNHGHGHEHGHNLEDEEEDDEDEQMMDDPQVHGSPVLDSTVIRSENLGQGITPGQTGVNTEKSTDRHEDPYNRNVRDEGETPGGLRDDMGRTTAVETEGGRAAFRKVADSPVMGREEANVGQTGVKIGQSVHSPSGTIPPSNFQSKVVEPTGTGGEEADVAPLVGQFGKMNVRDQTDPKSNPVSESSTIRTSSGPENPESTLKTKDMPRDTVTGKLSYATSAITDKAISAKNLVASNLGYGGHEEGQDSQKATAESAPGVAATMTEKLAPVYHKVVDASSVVMSKVQGSGTRDGGGDRATNIENEGKGTDKGISVKDYLAEKFRPGDEDKALSEAISGALQKKKGETGKPVGEVTESEQMARRLGSGSENKREGEDAPSAGNESKGTGMVGGIKDAVGSWLGK